MRIALIDDEKYARLELAHQIHQVLPDVEILEASNGTQALDLIGATPFDLLFIDIRLGDIPGTTIAALARKLLPQAHIVFATAYSEYAVTAFELQVDNYILKPFDPRRIRQILEMTLQKTDHGAHAIQYERIAVNCNRHTILLDIDDVVYIETSGSGKGCILHTISGESYQDSSTLGEFEQRLHKKGFFRTHKTALIQLKYIQDIFPWSNSSFALRVRGSSTPLPIGRDKLKELRRRLTLG